uniref:U-box domain-containing protein 62 n=1 Tax=Anthurium amnicola TaxID=1678845 RepID=A0A1D1ZDR7_9ARAE
MASERMDLAPLQRAENGLRSMAAFQDESAQFSRGGGDPAAAAAAAAQKPRTARFVVEGNDKVFAPDRDSRFFRAEETGLQAFAYRSPGRTGPDQGIRGHDWNAEGSNGTSSGEGSDGMEDEDDDEDQDEEDDVDDEGDDDVVGLVCTEDGSNKNQYNSSSSLQSSSEKTHQDTVDLHERYSSFGSSRGALVKDGNSSNGKGSFSEQQQKLGQAGHYDKRVPCAEPDLYHAQIMHEGDGLGGTPKELGRENGFGSSWRKDISLSVDSGESVRTHLSDPITGFLMDDAMILSCGHSYGISGLQHVTRMKACSKCQQPVLEEKVLPNLALRLAVQAFRREQDSQSSKVSKRRRDRLEQEKCNHDDPFPLDLSRGKGVQFPFTVSDKVIIKGNKRTPLRFVGRVAVVTTQCLNGWYVVKTLDNAESVKLQYRSLAKVTTDEPGSNVVSSKANTNWL